MVPSEQGAADPIPLGLSSRPSDTVGRRVLAERDTVLELLAVFTHDLSNPLQSLIVLSELAADELTPGTEEYQRARQCVEAAERMRTLVQALAGTTRHAEASRSLDATGQRIMHLLGRRFERHRIEVTFDLRELSASVPPPVVELALLVIAMGVVAVANEASHAGFRIHVQARPSEDRATLDVSTLRVGTDASTDPVSLADPHVQRLHDLVDGTSLHAEIAPGSATLWWAPSGGAG